VRRWHQACRERCQPAPSFCLKEFSKFHLSRRFAVASITILAMGAGAAPALAAGPTPLVRAITKLQPTTQLNLTGSLRTTR
jgi:hypothetical protein